MSSIDENAARQMMKLFLNQIRVQLSPEEMDAAYQTMVTMSRMLYKPMLEEQMKAAFAGHLDYLQSICGPIGGGCGAAAKMDCGCQLSVEQDLKSKVYTMRMDYSNCRTQKSHG